MNPNELLAKMFASQQGVGDHHKCRRHQLLLDRHNHKDRQRPRKKEGEV